MEARFPIPSGGRQRGFTPDSDWKPDAEECARGFSSPPPSGVGVKASFAIAQRG